MKNRPGYSLIEMVLAISALSVVLALCVGSIRGLITLDRAARARLNERVALDRLGRQFRQDVRAARSVRTPREPGKGAQLELQLEENRVVEYRWDAGRLIRTEHRAGTPDRREPYRLPGRKPPQFQSKNATGQTTVSLVLERKTTAAPTSPDSEFRAEAKLGKDRRWSHERSQSR